MYEGESISLLTYFPRLCAISLFFKKVYGLKLRCQLPVRAASVKTKLGIAFGSLYNPCPLMLPAAFPSGYTRQPIIS